MTSKRDVSPNTRNAPKVGYPISNKVKQQNEHDVLIQQLWDMNAQLKGNLGQESAIMSTTPREQSRGDTQNSLSSSRIKNDEIQRMRNEKLERIRNENRTPTRSKTPERRDQAATSFATDRMNRNPPRDVSPRLLNEKSTSDRYRVSPNTSAKESSYRVATEGSDHSSVYHSNMSHASPPQNRFKEGEQYPYAKLFNRQKDKDRTDVLLQEAVEDEIKRLANKSKMSQNSYKILIRKLETSLNAVISHVDRLGNKHVGFEQLGKIFSELGIFRIIQYDEECRLANEEQFYSGNPQDQKRRYQEMVVHEEVWNLLADNEEAEQVPTDSVYAFFRIILDPANLASTEIARLLQDYIIKDEQKRDAQGVPLENPKLLELIKNLKSMTINRLHYDQTGHLKPEKAEEIAKKNDELTFKPKINEMSQAIDRTHAQKFREKNVLEKKDRSVSPYQKQNQKQKTDNLDDLLFDLKGMQSALHGKGDLPTRMRTEGDEAIREQESEVNSSRSRVQDTSKFTAQDSFVDNRLNMLYKKQEISEKRKEEQRKKKELEDMKDCTFQPMIKNYHSNSHRDPNETVERLYTQHLAKKKKEEQVSMEQIEKETKEMEECTFKPEILNSTVSQPKTTPKGFDKNIMRMRKATDEAQKKKEALEKKYTGENYEKMRNAKIKPPSFLENPRYERSPPFVYIEVGVGAGRTGKIGIHEDDDPRILAKNFAVAFQLNEEMEMNLVDIIAQQLDDHFTKQGYQNHE